MWLRKLEAQGSSALSSLLSWIFVCKLKVCSATFQQDNEALCEAAASCFCCWIVYALGKLHAPQSKGLGDKLLLPKLSSPTLCL